MMRHNRPATPLGVTLSGCTLNCPACHEPGALEGWRGGNQVILCRRCGHGYGEQYRKRTAVATRMKIEPKKVDRDALRHRIADVRKRKGMSNGNLELAMGLAPDVKYIFKIQYFSPAQSRLRSEEFMVQSKKAIEWVDINIPSVDVLIEQYVFGLNRIRK